MKVKPEPQAGDPCPQCGRAFIPALVPTPEQESAATNREFRQPLPDGYDTAERPQREELGALHTCQGCGYRTRFKAAAGEVADDSATKPATRTRRPAAAGATTGD